MPTDTDPKVPEDTAQESDGNANPYQNLGFIYFLKKPELIETLSQRGQDTSGTVQELRQRLSRHLKELRMHRSTQNLCAEWEDKVEKRNNADPSTEDDYATASGSNVPPSMSEQKQQKLFQSRLPVPLLPKLAMSAPTSSHPVNCIPPARSERATSTPPHIEHHDSSNTYQPAATYPTSSRFGRSFEAELMNTVRKWGFRFDGSGRPLEFLERIEDLALCYEIPLNDMLRTLPEILRNTALEWFRINRDTLTNWAIFRQAFLRHFLPARYFHKLEDEIMRKRQGPKEKAKDYVRASQYLIRQHPRMTIEDNIDRIYDGLRPEYRLYIKRMEFTTLDELMDLAEEYEFVRQEDRNSRPASSHQQHQYTTAPVPRLQVQSPSPAFPRQAVMPLAPIQRPTVPYDRNTHCWQCKQRGHNKKDCRRPFRLFCSYCGEDGRLTKDCPCHRSSNAVLGQMDPTGSMDPRPFVYIKAGDQIYCALVDTGSSRSFIGPGLREECRQLGVARRDQPHAVEFADGRTAVMSEHYVLTLKLNNKIVEGEAIFLPNLSEDAILGMDYLGKAGCTLRLGGRRLTMGRPATPLEDTRICASSDVVANHQDARLKEFLDTELPKFNDMRGISTVAPHNIRLKTTEPFKQRYYPRNPAMQKIIDEEIDDLLQSGKISPSKSPYSSPLVLVRKKEGSWRVCIDFRQLNEISFKDAYPLPYISAILDKLRGARYMSTIDLKQGYWQIALKPECRPYTAFTVPGRGLYEWNVMPCGLHSAGATFQRAMDEVFGPDMQDHVLVYLDDIIVLSKTFEDHLAHLKEVFRRLRKVNLKINFDKCHFCRPSLKYLGHVISSEGIHTDPDKVAAVRDLKAPTNLRELRRILGICSWYRRFIQDFSTVAAPLTRLLKKAEKWNWTNEQQKAFETLKQRLTEAPVLACPDFTQQFTLQTDASQTGLGVVLTQNLEGHEKVIAYASRTLTDLEVKYAATEKECLAILWGIRKMRPYLEGYQFKVVTDHHSLKWLHSLENPSGRLARWALELQQYDFTIQYRKGALNVVADALSRDPLPISELDRTAAARDVKPDWTMSRKEQVRLTPSRYPDYKIENDQLYRRFTSSNPAANPNASEWKLCVPTADRNKILFENHDVVTAGHFGIAKTTARIMLHYYWPGMFRDIAKYIQQCKLCLQFKSSQQKPSGTMHTSPSDFPWDVVCADFVGPLPRSTRGNTMLLVMVDKFSKWVEAVPMHAATTPGLIKAVRERIITRFGVPRTFLSDNGSQFTSRPFKDFLSELGIAHRLTAPYTPQENYTERVNRVLKTMIAQYTQGDQRKWDEHIPELSFALNTSRHESTGFSPAFLNFGREMRVPGHLLAGSSLDAPLEEPNLRTERMRTLFALARLNLQCASQTQAKYYNLRHRPWRPCIGERVYKRNRVSSSAANHFTEKLAPKYEGPYEVVKFVSPVIVVLRKPGPHRHTDVKTRAHIRDLKGATNSYNTDRSSTSATQAIADLIQTPTIARRRPYPGERNKNNNLRQNYLIRQVAAEESRPDFSIKKFFAKQTRKQQRLFNMEGSLLPPLGAKPSVSTGKRSWPVSPDNPCKRRPTQPRRPHTVSRPVVVEFMQQESGKKFTARRVSRQPVHPPAIIVQPPPGPDVAMFHCKSVRDKAQQLWDQRRKARKTVEEPKDPKPKDVKWELREADLQAVAEVRNRAVRQIIEGPAAKMVTWKDPRLRLPLSPLSKNQQRRARRRRNPTVMADPFRGIDRVVRRDTRPFILRKGCGAIKVTPDVTGTQATMEFQGNTKVVPMIMRT